jgi:hypothetical protein
VLLFAGLVVLAEGKKPSGNDEAAHAAAVKLYQSLTDDQKKDATLAYDDKEKYKEDFPAVVRKGIAFTKLTPEQKAMITEVIAAMTSDYGAMRCLEVGKQTPDSARYLTYFGKPEDGKPFAWRIGQHHLTLIYAEFGKDLTAEFGPILLGGNPVNKLWEDEEKLLLELRAALSEAELKQVTGKGNNGSGQAIGRNGVKIKELSDKPKELAKKLFEQRLAVFSADRRKALEELIKKDGGVDELRIALWGDATKSHLDGGNYAWKFGSPSFVCDWQTVGKNHIHSTVRYKAKS